MKDFFEKQRLTKEEAEKEAGKIRELVGDRGSRADYQTANELVDDESMKNGKKVSESLQKERITIIPSEFGKHVMIGFDTEDPDLYDFFDDAARTVTEKYHGFHQVGSGNQSGYTAWELWNLRGAHPSKVVDEIYAEMLRLQKLYNPEKK